MVSAREGHEAEWGVRVASSLLAILLAVLPAAARAQEASSLLEQGVTLLEAGDPAGAVEHLRRAHAVEPTPRISFNLAMALAQHGDFVEARFLLRRLVASGDVNLLIREAASQLLERVAPQVATVRVRVEGGSPDQRVVIDGSRGVGEGREVSLDPGSHRVEVRSADGAVLARSEVELEPGARAEVVLRPVGASSRAALPGALEGGTTDAASRVEPSSGSDDVWIWIGVGTGIAVVVAAVVTGTVIALSGQGGASIDGDLDDVHVGGAR